MPKEEKKAERSVRTKKMLADTLEKLCRTKPIHDIRIKDLCGACGLKRQSFYYHFCDKQELVAWIFREDFEQARKNAEVMNSYEMINSLMKIIYIEKRAFYRNLLQDTSQNNLRVYMQNMYIEIEISALKKYLKTEELEADLLYSVRSYSYACMEHTCRWLFEDEMIPAEELARQFYVFMPDILKKAYEEM